MVEMKGSIVSQKMKNPLDPFIRDLLQYLSKSREIGFSFVALFEVSYDASCVSPFF